MEQDDGTLDDDSAPSAEESEDAKPVRKGLTQLVKWANRNKAMRERKDGYIKRATCDTWPESLGKLCQGGCAIVNNWTSLMSRLNQPDSEQRDCIIIVPVRSEQRDYIILVPVRSEQRGYMSY